ncbi:MAG: OmpH family outer membrane protein [Nitrospirae bacterium]|nr:OmpH family outer membrane protein [Nitrospirota bacterium]
MNCGKWLGAAGALLLVLGPATGSLAAEAFKVGVIDQQVVLEKTKAGKKALESLKEFSASRQKIISADDEEMKKLENELRAQESGLSEAAKREKQELFRTKLENYQRRLQEFNREIQTKQKEMADEYLKKMNPVVAAVAEKAGCAAVLDKGSDTTLRIVLYHRDTVDLTDEVVKEFDRRYK